jgi:hypothetical protein
MLFKLCPLGNPLVDEVGVVGAVGVVGTTGVVLISMSSFKPEC